MYANNIIYSCMIILLYNDALKTTCNVMISVSEDEQVYNIQNLMLTLFSCSLKPLDIEFMKRLHNKVHGTFCWYTVHVNCLLSTYQIKLLVCRQEAI